MSDTDHTSDPMADRWEALTQAIRAERDAHRKLRAERDAHRERAEHAEARATAAETIRQKADAWDEGYTSGHSRAMRRMSDEPNVEPGTNPYRAALTPPTTTEETTHE